jgi:UDP-glucose 4-epimerase
MKYIVIGGAGFIGSHLCEELENQGHQVWSVDDYSGGYEENLNHLNTEQVRWDITDVRAGLSNLFKRIQPDGVFNQAASKKTVCLANPARDLEVNIKGAFNVALTCKEQNIRLVHASTGSVYGEAKGMQDESHPTNPVSYYGISKLAGEKYASFICDAVVLRYFHVYGTRQESKDDKGGVLAIWRRRLEEGKPIILYGDGTQERSFTHVKDVAMANIVAMEKGQGVYNVASGYTYTLNDMINILRTRYDVVIAQQDWQEGDVKKFYVDNTRISNLMKKEWVRLQEGMFR